jgi:hypothetical protein
MKLIQAAGISVVFVDAPPGEKVQAGRRRRAGRQDPDVKHPAVVKTFAGPEGRQGPISTSPISDEVGVGLQTGWLGNRANVNWSQSRTKDEIGVAKVDTMRTGPQRSCLLIDVVENPVDASGIPAFAGHSAHSDQSLTWLQYARYCKSDIWFLARQTSRVCTSPWTRR